MAKHKDKQYQDMNLEELREATAEFDKPLIIDAFEPMTDEQQAEWERLRKTPHERIMPKNPSIMVRFDRELLEKTDELARRKGVSRDALIRQALRKQLAADGGK
ncbi:MAG: ribbon-helix-helix protein, CopG family [Phycisphaera sp.]|nr:ribbon-helix-helix protein, CopG family [Phycisphaera sp.]